MKQLNTNQLMLTLLEKMNTIIDNMNQLDLLVQKNQKNKWLHSSDVKKKLGISERTIQRWRKNNSIPYKRIGDSYWYPSTFFDLTMTKRPSR